MEPRNHPGGFLRGRIPGLIPADAGLSLAIPFRVGSKWGNPKRVVLFSGFPFAAPLLGPIDPIGTC